MEKKSLRYVAMGGLILVASFLPARAIQENMIFYNGRYILPPPGVSIRHTPEGDELVMDISKYELHGNVISYDPDTLDIFSYQDDSINP